MWWVRGFRSYVSVLKLIVAMVAQLGEYTKNHWIAHFNGWIVWHANYISIRYVCGCVYVSILKFLGNSLKIFPRKTKLIRLSFTREPEPWQTEVTFLSGRQGKITYDLPVNWPFFPDALPISEGKKSPDLTENEKIVNPGIMHHVGNQQERGRNKLKWDKHTFKTKCN